MNVRLLMLSGALWITSAAAGPFDNAVGTWWGQAEYAVKVNSVVDD